MTSSVYDAAYAALVREQLDDPSGSTAIWTDAQIIYHVDRAVRVLSSYYPYKQETVLPIRSEGKDVYIAALNNQFCIHSVEHPLDRSNIAYRTIEDVVGNYMRLKLDFTTTVTATALTGTLTFTNGSTAVTGSGTLFSTELEAGEYIHKYLDTNGEYYKVFSITSNTALVLERPYQGTSGADTANLSKMMTYDMLVRIIWGGLHTLSDTASTLPVMAERIVTDGACAYSLRAWAAESRRRLDAAVTVIGTGSDQIDKMAKPVNDALEHFVIGAPLINRTNPGQAVASLRAQYGVANLQRAQARGEIGERYFSEAVKEMNAATGILAHVVAEADRREAIFREGLNWLSSQYQWPRYEEFPRSA